LIAWLVVGALAGWIAGMVVKGDEGYGVIGTIVAGIVGASLPARIGRPESTSRRCSPPSSAPSSSCSCGVPSPDGEVA
jgi:hypothetical protein